MAPMGREEILVYKYRFYPGDVIDEPYLLALRLGVYRNRKLYRKLKIKYYVEVLKV